MNLEREKVYDLVSLGELLYASHPNTYVTLFTTTVDNDSTLAVQTSNDWTRTGDVFYQLTGTDAIPEVGVEVFASSLYITYASEEVSVTAVVYGKDVDDEKGLLGYLKQIFTLRKDGEGTYVGY